MKVLGVTNNLPVKLINKYNNLEEKNVFILFYRHIHILYSWPLFANRNLQNAKNYLF